MERGRRALVAAESGQALEFVVDAVPHGTADDGCPPVPLPSAVSAGVSSCLYEGRLKSDGRTVETSIFDIDALRIAEYAVAHRASVLICPADPLSPVPALIAATAHVDAMVRGLAVSGRYEPSPLRIGVVTSDYHLRGFYRGLAVAERLGAGGVPMRSIVPAATLSGDGTLSVIDRDDGRWSTVFVESVAAARRIGALDLLIVDLPVADADKLDTGRVPTVVVTRDPADPLALRMAGRMPAFAYDGTVQAGAGPAATVGYGAARLANRAGQRVRIVPVVAPSVCTDAGMFWSDIASLLRLAGRSPFMRELAYDAFALFHDLISLAMPIEVFEQTCDRSFRARVEDLTRAARIVADRELGDEWLPMVEAELSGLLGVLRSAERDGTTPGVGYTTKTAVLPALLAEALDAGRDVLVVTRTAVLARAYTQHLTRRWSTVRVASIGELARTRPADVAVLLGMAPTWGRWVYRSGVGRDLSVLAYTGQTPRSLGKREIKDRADFDEAELVRTAVGLQTGSGLGMSAPAQRTRAYGALRCGRPQDGGYVHSKSDAGDTSLMVPGPRPPEVPPGLWDGDGWTAHIEPGAAAAPKNGAGSDVMDVAPGLRVTFTDGTWAWLHRHSLVWCWRAHGSRSVPVEAGRLTAGDALVLIDGDAHKTLLAKVLEVSSEIPELAAASAWIDYWRTALARAHTRCGSYTALERELVARGCRVQPQTVRLWCIGSTIGPDDPEDVRRVGELLGDPVLTTRQPDVSRAMRTLRHSHVRLLNRLASLARSVGPAAANGHRRADEILDEASGLTAADIETAVVVVTVADVQVVGAVPRVLAGRRRDADEPSDLILTSPDEEQQ